MKIVTRLVKEIPVKEKVVRNEILFIIFSFNHRNNVNFFDILKLF